MSFAPSGSYNTTTGGYVTGGSFQGNPMSNATEEWTAQTAAVNIETLTTS